MASWIAHQMIADALLARLPSLDRRGFCVGSVAPDCNVPNGDGTFTPAREITHCMTGPGKETANFEAFMRALPRMASRRWRADSCWAIACT